MATYILLSSLTDDGAETIKKNPERIQEVNQELARLGVTITAQYAVLGPYDFVNIVDSHSAPPSDGDPRIFPGGFFARLALPGHVMLLSHERRDRQHLRLGRGVWVSFCQRSKRTMSTICPL